MNMYIWCERLTYSTVPIFVIWFCMLIFCGVKYVWCENCFFFFLRGMYFTFKNKAINLVFICGVFIKSFVGGNAISAIILVLVLLLLTQIASLIFFYYIWESAVVIIF
jgi:hypothetical protein